jgi:hypothetical protein
MKPLNDRTLLVVGCQRSGTMIASKMLADYFGSYHLDEFDILPAKKGAWYLAELCNRGYTNLVVQAPIALKEWQLFYSAVPNIKFVCIKRKKEDIINSMRRIEWLKDDHLEDWEEFMDMQVDLMYGIWDDLKERAASSDWAELEYDDLRTNPLFVSEEERSDFTVKQWKKDEPCGHPTWRSDDVCIQAKMKERHAK